VMAVKAKHPALHNRSRRQAVPTAAPDKHYAFVRAARDGDERLLVVLNFQPVDQTVEIDFSGVDFESSTDLLSGARAARQAPMRVPLPAFGYGFFALNRAKDRA